jgi:hypothetical protein
MRQSSHLCLAFKRALPSEAHRLPVCLLTHACLRYRPGVNIQICVCARYRINLCASLPFALTSPPLLPFILFQFVLLRSPSHFSSFISPLHFFYHLLAA